MPQGASPSLPRQSILKDLRSGLWGAMALSAVISVLMLTGSVYMLQVYDRVLASGSVVTLLTLFAIVVTLFGFLAIYDGLRMRLLSRLALRLDRAHAATAFQADLAALQSGGRPAGLVADLELLRSVLAGPPTLALFDLPFTLLFVGILFIIHPLLGWLTLAGMGLAAVLALLNRMVLAKPMAQQHEADHRQRRFADGARIAAPTLAAMGMTGAVTRRWQALHWQKLQRQQQGFEPSEVLSALSRSLRMLLQSGLLTAAAWLVIDGAITAGAIVAASVLSGRALAPVDQLIAHWRSLTGARAALDRLSAMGAAPSRAAMDLPPISGALEIRNLTRHAAAAEGGAARAPVLDDLSFTLAPGAGLGIIGASASGKSTLARLIVGAIAPDGGEIRFDGATASQWDPDRLGRQIGYLPQRVDLLPGTVRDNIARFDPDASDATVIKAAQAAGVHEMILHLPQGYATELGGHDMPLSGGQVQRIGLARALYGNPRLLVLDEPNAHLDMAGEAALVRCLQQRRAKGVTVIVLAHRAGALAAVDRLMVLKDGRIMQDGPRDTVLAALARPAPPKPRVTPKVTIRSMSSGVTVTGLVQGGQANDLPGTPPARQKFRQSARERVS